MRRLGINADKLINFSNRRAHSNLDGVSMWLASCRSLWRWQAMGRQVWDAFGNWIEKINNFRICWISIFDKFCKRPKRHREPNKVLAQTDPDRRHTENFKFHGDITFTKRQHKYKTHTLCGARVERAHGHAQSPRDMRATSMFRFGKYECRIPQNLKRMYFGARRERKKQLPSHLGCRRRRRVCVVCSSCVCRFVYIAFYAASSMRMYHVSSVMCIFLQSICDTTHIRGSVSFTWI